MACTGLKVYCGGWVVRQPNSAQPSLLKNNISMSFVSLIRQNVFIGMILWEELPLITFLTMKMFLIRKRLVQNKELNLPIFQCFVYYPGS